MANNTITSANSVFIISAGTLYTNQQLQGFMADRAFETSDADIAELVMGVDGVLSAGWIPYMVAQTIYIMPDSPSQQIFEDAVEYERTTQTKLVWQGQINLPSISRSYTCTNGYLTRMKAVPDAMRVLAGRGYTITWNTISAGPLAT